MGTYVNILKDGTQKVSTPLKGVMKSFTLSRGGVAEYFVPVISPFCYQHPPIPIMNYHSQKSDSVVDKI